MSKFDQYWETVENSFASDAVRYFTKPMLRAAFEAGRAAVEKKPKRAIPITNLVAGGV